jgi:hypothetical protein
MDPNLSEPYPRTLITERTATSGAVAVQLAHLIAKHRILPHGFLTAGDIVREIGEAFGLTMTEQLVFANHVRDLVDRTPAR